MSGEIRGATKEFKRSNSSLKLKICVEMIRTSPPFLQTKMESSSPKKTLTPIAYKPIRIIEKRDN